MTSGFRLLLDKLVPYGLIETRKGWKSQCPSHDDQHPSLDITEGAKGTPLLLCRAGCDTDAVLAALEVTWPEVLADDNGAADKSPTSTSKATMNIVACYDYGDEDGVLLYQVVRLAPKGFRQRRPDGDKWRWGIGDVRRVLFRLPEVITSARSEGTIFVCEGEKDVLALEALKLVATTNAGGAGKWRPEHTQSLRGAYEVVILTDNDDLGRNHGLVVAASCHSAGIPVKAIALPGLPEKGDVSDWIAAGGTREQLEGIARDAVAWAPAIQETTDVTECRSSSLQCLADVVSEPIQWLWYGRLAFGKLALLDGDPGLGKSTMTLDIAARATTGREMPFSDRRHAPFSVVFASAEDGAADTIRPRFDASGGDPKMFHLLSGRADSTGLRATISLDDVEYIERAVREVDARLLVLDPLSAFLPEKTDSFKDASVRRALAPIVAMAERLGIAVLVVRHLTKAGGLNPLYRGQGSIGIIGAARLGLMVGPHPDDASRCIIAVSKSNLGEKPSSLAYRIEAVEIDSGIETSRIAWEGPVKFTASDLVATPDEPEAGKERDVAKRFLLERLADGPKLVKEIEKEAREVGIYLRTLRRAKNCLGVGSKKPAMQGGWTWELPELPPEDAHPTEKMSSRNRVVTFGNSGHLRDVEALEAEIDPWSDGCPEVCS